MSVKPTTNCAVSNALLERVRKLHPEYAELPAVYLVDTALRLLVDQEEKEAEDRKARVAPPQVAPPQ